MNDLIHTVMGMAALRSMHSALILLILVLCSLFALALIFERGFFFRRIKVDSDKVLQKIRESMIAGRVEESLQLLGDVKHNPILELIQTGIKSSRLTREEAIEMMRISQVRARARLERSLGLLGTLGNVSPFIGLLGTVMGIMQAFKDLAGPAAQAGGASVVAVGIAEALVATAAGLMVAIPAVVFYNHYLRKAKEVLTQMEITGLEFGVLLSLKESAKAE